MNIKNHSELKNGKYGPVFDTYLDGYVTQYYLDGKHHNEDGPAMIIEREGRIEQLWAIHGKEYTEQDFKNFQTKKFSEKLATDLDKKSEHKKKKI